MKRIICIILTLALCAALPVAALADEPAAPAADTADSFCTDVKTSDYFFAPVFWAYLNGICKGVDDTHFAPDALVTRADAAVILYRFAKRLGYGFTGDWMFPLDYGDAAQIPGYAYEAVAWCGMNGIVAGYADGNFGAGDKVTREQFAVMLYRLAKYAGEQGFTGAWYFPLDFGDASSVSSWADEAMHWCVMKGIMVGTDGGTLMPNKPASRGAAATMLCRLCAVLCPPEEESGSGVSAVSNEAESRTLVYMDDDTMGAVMQIRIRGTRSLNASDDPLIVLDGSRNIHASNDPLIVLDGIPFLGSLSDISPSDIKSMDILKDDVNGGEEKVLLINIGTAHGRSDIPGEGTAIRIRGVGSMNSTEPLVLVDSVGTQNVLNALQGKVAGVDITQTSSAPGSAAQIVIRGARSVNGDNQPLYIVDGVAAPSADFVSPSDIETIEVLKDGASADPSARIRGIGSFGSTAPLFVIDGVPMGTSIRDSVPGGTIAVMGSAKAGSMDGKAYDEQIILVDGAAPENVAQALQGSLAGVNVIQQDGRPGERASIRVRGYSSNSQNIGPLLIVDGLEYGQTMDIPASEIEFMDILKD